MTPVPEPGAVYRLLAWLSPAYPVGAYTDSHGLEWAVEVDAVRDGDSAGAGIDDVLRHGGGRSDGILLAHARRADDAATVAELAERGTALAPGVERRLETTAQGRAFLAATQAAWPTERLAWLAALPVDARPYPVVVGVAAAGHGLPLGSLLPAYLHAFTANLVSAAVRLVPRGRSDGQRLVARFEPAVHAVAEAAAQAPREEVGGATLLADLASPCHETQYSRLFRS
jgi:urease accessory protein